MKNIVEQLRHDALDRDCPYFARDSMLKAADKIENNGKGLIVLTDSHNDLIVAMQSAFIEWQHGGGAEAAMQWIINTLDGPGLTPGDDEPYGKEAQAWWDVNNSHPMPKCSVCGRPSNRCGGGVAACSEEHWQQAKKI